MEKRRRVLYVIKTLAPAGGAEILLLGLAEAMQADHRVEVAHLIPGSDLVAGRLEKSGIRVHQLGSTARTTPIRWTLALRRIIAQSSPDLIHAHLPMAGVVARIASMAARTPLIYTEHNLPSRYHPLTRFASRATWRLQEQVLAVSEEVLRDATKTYGDRVPIRVLANGVDTERFVDQREEGRRIRRSLSIPPSAPVVGSVAVFRQAKRLDIWLRVAKQVVSELPDCRFLLVGFGPLGARIEQWRKELGLEEVVHLVGAQSDVRPFLSAMDVYLMTSAFEGLPVALLEAMSMERAVVTTPAGGIPQAVESDVNGLVVPMGSERQLAQATVELLLDDDRRTRLGERARESVAERFSIDAMTNAVRSVYDRIA